MRDSGGSGQRGVTLTMRPDRPAGAWGVEMAGVTYSPTGNEGKDGVRDAHQVSGKSLQGMLERGQAWGETHVCP